MLHMRQFINRSAIKSLKAPDISVNYNMFINFIIVSARELWILCPLGGSLMKQL